MTEFYKALEKEDFERIKELLDNDLADIDEDLSIDDKKQVHCLEYAIGKPLLFSFLLKKGANPLCSISAIIKDVNYLERVLVEYSADIDSPIFPFVAKKFSSLRGKKKTNFHKLLLRYNFPTYRCGEWIVK